MPRNVTIEQEIQWRLTVGPTSTFPTIAAAMAAAGTGDIISLEAGYGNENALVTVDGLSFDGGPSSTDINLQLATGISAITLLGTAPINLADAPDANTVVGNDGDNIISVSSGVDVITAGNGTDRLIIDYSAATASITGTTVDVTDGGTHAVTFTGVEDFTISTGSGNDTITVADGSNVLNTGAGDDTITTGNGPNIIDGGANNDTITAGAGANTINGGSGNDTIIAGDGGNTVDGGDGDDGISTGIGDDVVTAGLGNDTVITSAGADVITVNGGIDTVDAGSESDRLIVDFSSSATAVIGGVTGGALAGGYDGVFADGAGTSSVVFLGTENFTVTTGSNNDFIATGDGDDVLDGGAGSDQLNGGGGSDTLVIGLGDDALDGGADLDAALFSSARANYRITDLGNGVFQSVDLRAGSPDGTDTLVNIEGFVFTDGTFDAVTVLAVAPATLVTSLAFSADTGTSNSDFITNTAAQTISGTLGVNLVSGERVEVSLDGGSTWATASSSVGSNAFSLAGQTLAGDNVLKARVSNASGGGTAASQAYVLDTSGPAQPSTPDLAVGSDSGLSNTDNITSVTTPTFGGTAENGSTVTLYDTDGTTELGSGVVSGGAWSIAASALGEGAHTISARATDAAGNRGALSSGLLITIDTTPPAGPGIALAHDTSVSSIDHVTSNPQINYSGDNGATLLYNADTAASFSSTVPAFTTEGLHTVLVEQRDIAGNVGAAASLSFTLDTIAPHLTGITASPGSTGHFTLAFDEAVNVTGGTPTLTLNDGATAVFNVAATAALHDATKLAFDYPVSSGYAPPSLAITSFVSPGATVDDLAGNHAYLGNVAAAFAALSVNEPVGTIIPAFTINGFTGPALQLDTTAHIILDEAASNWAAAYGLKALHVGVPESIPYPPVADTHHLSDGHLM
jgi:Ca2+-binding RTX toxin-like protein